MKKDVQQFVAAHDMSKTQTPNIISTLARWLHCNP